MTPRHPLVRRARAGAVALGAVLALSACSAAGPPGAAAVVDGEVVPESDVRTVVTELPPELTGGQPVPASDVIAFFVVEDTVRRIAAEFTGVISTEQVEEQLAAQLEQQGAEVGTLSEPTLQLFATSAMLQQIQATDVAREEFEAAVEELDVEVNPRYGELTDGLAVVPAEYEWLRPSDGAAPAEG
jgi:hypothetical protein